MIIYLQMIESDEDKSKFEQLYIMYKGLMFHVAMKILKNELCRGCSTSGVSIPY